MIEEWLGFDEKNVFKGPIRVLIKGIHSTFALTYTAALVSFIGGVKIAAAVELLVLLAQTAAEADGRGGGGGYVLMSRTFVIYKDAISSLPNLPQGVK